jgi:chromosome segregation ATPase
MERQNVGIANIKSDVDRLGKLVNGDPMNRLVTHVDDLLQADEDFRSLSEEIKRFDRDCELRIGTARALKRDYDELRRDVDILKEDSLEYGQAFDLVIKDFDEINQKIESLKPQVQKPAEPRNVPPPSRSEEVSRKENILAELKTEAIRACEEKRPADALAFGKSGSDAANIWPRDWDVAMIVREFDRRARYVGSD